MKSDLQRKTEDNNQLVQEIRALRKTVAAFNEEKEKTLVNENYHEPSF